MDDLALALHLALDPEQTSAQHDSAARLEEPRPDHQVGHAGLVLNGDEGWLMPTSFPTLLQRPAPSATKPTEPTKRRRRTVSQEQWMLL
ncbi:hypothetical protein FHG71_21335 [Rubellimicrobium roseum]|uniref:Uncharacterized protein n=1 Tax=Rubellimicrobium roseum TaxID=687525 RepID=A0A5C4N9Z0_9RHOB|nr:hypothetical protein FHG71_21335 [Rubellimicrobium roseum]